MAGSWPKVIRDSVHGLIRFADQPLDRLLLELVDCREFQRLRRIKQLGFAHLVFPAATHTRFSHSLGVMWNARKFIARLRQLDSKLVDESQEAVIVVGALLHDLGHGPFSHAFEKVTGTKHERRTVEIILGDSTEIHRRLSEYKPVSEMPLRVASLFPEGLDLVEEAGGVVEIPRYLADVVSSQLDADRFDYLVRDSHSCGTEYGRFDVDWLLDHLFVDNAKSRLFLSRKAQHAVEEYVFARYHMYQSVYFHKTIRAAEVMLRLLMKRGRMLLEATPPDSAVRDAAGRLGSVLRGEGTLDDFLQVDDDTLTEFVKACSTMNDRTLAYLARGLLNRRLYKCLDMTDMNRGNPRIVGRFNQSVGRFVAERGVSLPVDPDFAVPDDAPADTPYKIYDPDSDDPATQIYVEMDTGGRVELSTTSEIVDALKKKVSLLRYYFPTEIRDDIEKIARKSSTEE